MVFPDFRNRLDRTRAILAPALLGVALLAACGDRSDPESPESRLLSRAIRAMWVAADPAALESIRIVARVQLDPASAGPAYRIETLAATGGSYREKVTWLEYGIAEVFAIQGEECWASVDATVVPLTPEKVAERRLRPLLFEISRRSPTRRDSNSSISAKPRFVAARRSSVSRSDPKKWTASR